VRWLAVAFSIDPMLTVCHPDRRRRAFGCAEAEGSHLALNIISIAETNSKKLLPPLRFLPQHSLF
jgi:hypothetical protein